MPKASKTVLPCTRAEVVGLEIDGEELTLGVSPTKLQRLCDDTRALLARGLASVDDMRRIVGRWTWGMLVRRPSLAVFNSVYRFMELPQRRSLLNIWPSVYRELNAAVGLAPLLFTSLEDAWCSHVVATDASLEAQGVVTCEVPPPVMAAVARDRSLPGGTDGIRVASPNNSPVMASAAELLLRDESKREAPHRPPPPAQLLDCVWDVAVSAAWDRKGESINSYEARAVHSGLRWALRLPASIVNRQLLVLSDSSAAVGALSKGRSSSHTLLMRCRSSAALLLASGVRLLLRWVPTEWNPADGPSRLIC